THQSLMIPAVLEGNKTHLLDPGLGWRPRPNHCSPEHQINSQGLRSTRDYAPTPAPGVLRVAAFGDSLVYGACVTNVDSWPAILEQTFPDIEVLNYGVLGYGLDQAYLRYQAEGHCLAPEVVLLGCTRTIGRCVNVYTPFRTEMVGNFPV